MAAARDELTRLNVFPVPDGDTGTNMCLTLRAVAQALRSLNGDAALPLPRVTDAMAQASVRGARGNSGMMLSQFLLGLQEGLGARLRASGADLAQAIRTGFDRLQASLDAGAKGFVRLLEGVKRLIEDGHVAEGAVDRLTPNAAALADVAADRDYGFCTELMVRGASLPPAAEVRRALREFGASIVVLQTGDLLKAGRADHAGDRRACRCRRVGDFLSGRGRNKRMTRAL